MPRPPLHLPVQPYPALVPPKEIPERDTFYAKLHAFRDEIGEPIQRLPTLGFKELDLWVLYKEVIKRNGIDAVIAKKQWKEVAEALQLPSSCTDSGFRLRLHYKKYLQAFERKYFNPQPNTDIKKSKKADKLDKLDRASSLLSSDSAATNLAGENSGTSSTPSSNEGAKREKSVKKKKRPPTKSAEKRKNLTAQQQQHRKPSEHVLKTSPLSTPQSPSRTHPSASFRTSQLEKTESLPASGGIRKKVSSPSRRTPASYANLSVLEAAVAAVDRERSASHSNSSNTSSAKIESPVRNHVDFSVLDNNSLQRYAEVYQVRHAEKSDKRALAEKVAAHFRSTPLVVDERETLIRFIRAIRRS